MKYDISMTCLPKTYVGFICSLILFFYKQENFQHKVYLIL